MEKILIIEPSSTLRHAVSRSLQAAYDIELAAGFDEGLRQVAGLYNNGDARFDGLVLGWPAQSCAATDEMLTLLAEPAYQDLAVLILAHDIDPGKLNWVAARPHTALLLWDNHREITQALDKLLASMQRAPEAEPLADEEEIRVLLVDDSPTVRVKFRRLLVSQGYVTETAGSVGEALEMARQHHFDIAIIDYFMPDATGDVLCQHLRNDPRTAAMTTAILTSTYLDKVITDSLAAGAVECMFKNEADALFLARVAAMSRTVRITKRIERQRQRLGGILSSVGDGVYGVDTEGRITFVNQATKRLLGYEQDTDLIGHRPEEVFHRAPSGSSGDSCQLRMAYQQGLELQGVETVFTLPDGSSIQVEMTIFPLRLEGRLEGAVVAFRDISMRKLLEEELKWQVNHDPLTQLLNRRYFEDALKEEVRRVRRGDACSALLYLDLDRFKYINDTLGHTTGDRLLVELGRHLNTQLRETDLLARIGGDEFGIILRTVSRSSVFEVADRYRRLLNSFDFESEGRRYKIHASIGCALIDRHTGSPGEALVNADIACHIAKGKGRNQTHLFDPGSSDDKIAMDMELGWSTRLATALEGDQFELYFQPIIGLQDIELGSLPQSAGAVWEQLGGRGIKGAMYEVLLRLHDRRGATVSPNAFLPTAERFNMMPQIDNWVVRRALEQLTELHARGVAATFSINLSGQSLANPEIVRIVRDAVSDRHLDPARVVFEITETCAIANIDAARRLIDELKALGCRFALDDFGSGYCSFSHLKNLSVDFIKIDGTFVQGIPHDPMDKAIVCAINSIAHSLGKPTIAESVEDAEALRALKECGVDLVQGFYLALPASGQALFGTGRDAHRRLSR